MKCVRMLTANWNEAKALTFACDMQYMDRKADLIRQLMIFWLRKFYWLIMQFTCCCCWPLSIELYSTMQYKLHTQIIEFAYWKLYCIIHCYKFLPILPTYPDLFEIFYWFVNKTLGKKRNLEALIINWLLGPIPRILIWHQINCILLTLLLNKSTGFSRLRWWQTNVVG